MYVCRWSCLAGLFAVVAVHGRLQLLPTTHTTHRHTPENWYRSDLVEVNLPPLLPPKTRSKPLVPTTYIFKKQLFTCFPKSRILFLPVDGAALVGVDVCEALVPNDLPPDRTAEILHQKLLRHTHTAKQRLDQHVDVCVIRGALAECDG